MRGVLVSRYGRTLSVLAQRELSTMVDKLTVVLNAEYGGKALKRLEKRIEAVVTETYADIAALVLADLNGFAANARDHSEEQLKRFLKRIAKDVAAGGTAFDVARRPILGRTVQKWITDAGAGAAARLSQAAVNASTSGVPHAEAVALVTGKNGPMKATRRGLESAVMASVHGVESYTVEDIARANSDVVVALEWVATLDGKTCFTPDTLVETPGGERPMGDLRTGDMVIGGSGKPRRVLETHRRTASRLIEIELENGRVLHCTRDHLFLDKHGNWIAAEDMIVGDDLAESFNELPRVRRRIS